MTPITIIDGIPFVSLVISVNGQEFRVDNVLVDTGSATTAVEADILAQAGVQTTLDDTISTRYGIGGEQPVVVKEIEKLSVDDLEVSFFEIDIAALDYGFGINGILGADFLIATGAVIDFKNLELSKA